MHFPCPPLDAAMAATAVGSNIYIHRNAFEAHTHTHTRPHRGKLGPCNGGCHIPLAGSEKSQAAVQLNKEEA